MKYGHWQRTWGTPLTHFNAGSLETSQNTLGPYHQQWRTSCQNTDRIMEHHHQKKAPELATSSDAPSPWHPRKTRPDKILKEKVKGPTGRPAHIWSGKIFKDLLNINTKLDQACTRNTTDQLCELTKDRDRWRAIVRRVVLAYNEWRRRKRENKDKLQ